MVACELSSSAPARPTPTASPRPRRPFAYLPPRDNALPRAELPAPETLDLARCRADVSAYLAWLGVPKPQVEELTQDVFMVALTRRSAFREESSIKTWLRGIAFHLVLNWRRRRRTRQLYEVGSVETCREESMKCNEASALDELLVKELCGRLTSVLALQSAVARGLWLRVVLEQTTVAEAARALNLTEDRGYALFEKTQRSVKAMLAPQVTRQHRGA